MNREGFAEIHALLSFKETASGKLEVMEFQLSCSQVLKDDAVKVLLSIRQQIWKAQQWPQDWERSLFTPIPKKGNAQKCSNYHTIAFISSSHMLAK